MKKFATALLVICTVITVLAAPYNLGRTSHDSNAYSSANARASVTKYTSTGAGFVTTGNAWYDAATTAGTSAKLIILSVSSGEPNTVLGVSNASTVPNGGGAVSFTFATPVSIAASTDYYIGVVSNGATAAIDALNGAASSGQMRESSSFTYASPPGSWPGSDYSTYDYVQLDVYVTVSDARPSYMLLLGVG